jgi:hypothetical protein
MFPVFAASYIGSRPDAIAFDSGTIDLDFEPPSLLPIRKTPTNSLIERRNPARIAGGTAHFPRVQSV